jgi:hypothetical protein
VPSPAAPPAAEVKTAKAPPSKLTVGGYAQIDYRRGDHGALANAPEHEFNVRRARLGVSGTLTERLAYVVTVQGDGLNANTASVIEAYGDVTLRPWVKVRAGQYKYDFDVEGRESAHQIPLPDRPFASHIVAGGLNGASTASSGSSSFRDRGISLLGSTRQGSVKWGYALGVFQGTGRASDNNNEFAYVAQGSAEPLAGLRLSAGYLQCDNAPEGSSERNDYRAFTAATAYDAGKWLLRGEYYDGRRRRASVREDADGFYLTAGYTPVPKLDLLVRYQQVEDGRFTTGGNRLRSVDVGLRWYLERKDRRSGSFLMLAYEGRDADDGFKTGVTVLNDGRGAALERGQDVKGVFVARLQVRF